MVKIDIFSGFLGAGKTTLIKKLIKEAYNGDKTVLIENEFGEIGVDGAFMQDAGIMVNELNSGCICCSLVGDFSKALKEVVETYHPERIIIEPSGVGKLSEIITAVKKADLEDAQLNTFTTVVDASKAKMYMKNFGEFFNNQIEFANCIIFSHTDVTKEAKIEEALALVKSHNATATIITTPFKELSGKEILAAMEHRDTLEAALKELQEHAAEEAEHEHHHHHHDDDEECEHEHHHHHHDDDEECEHEHHHHHDDEECEHEHHHHHHDDEECEHEHHHHHHDDEEECSCGCHHHHHHHADEIFTSWGVETAKAFSKEGLKEKLAQLENEEMYGAILRAKGVVKNEEGGFIHFDYIPGEADIRDGSAAPIGRLCVIGSKLKEEQIEELFVK